jgi:hypothetical protein
VPYNRFFLTALAQFPLSETIFAGIGPGLAYGAAFFSQDSSVVGAPQVSFTPVIDVGTRPGQGPFALEGALRLFVYERLEQFETDFRSTPVRHDIKQYPWFLELKLRVGR